MRGDERPSILIVEDEAAIRKLLAGVLEAEYQVLTAEDGRRALEIINQTPDLAMVLSDLVLPYMNGLELIQAIQRQTRSLPVVVITAHHERQRILEALRVGAYDFIAKPFDIGMIEAAVRRAVAHHAFLRLLESEIQLRAALGVAMRIAHEINNPLTVIKSVVEYHLAYSSMNRELRDDLVRIDHVVDSLAEQVRMLTQIRRVILDTRYGIPMLDLEQALEGGLESVRRRGAAPPVQEEQEPPPRERAVGE